ncbi:hypothetical protein ST47_g6994 [Ascochyta rabiei]|uniref:Uncharacterized protein n=1 Tax=Didymella rabiei TaxID=5454 RepID=A0A163BNL2_DIDRA|nr:hypothetical protein ST47_g6994 [Ascochyta rabiei]
MSFHYSAEDIRIEDGHILKARLQRADGDWNDSGELTTLNICSSANTHEEIDLNNHIGNDNGHFYWDGENFAGSAEEVHFTIEGDGSVPVLRANLVDQEGNLQQRDVNLSERISNNNGDFNYSKWMPSLKLDHANALRRLSVVNLMSTTIVRRP